jgi:hypothetical protein
VAAKKNRPEPRRVALFVEGLNPQTPTERDDLQHLWRYQCEKVSRLPPDQLDVYGFTKMQIAFMGPAGEKIKAAGKVPLDVAIELAFRKQAFAGLVVAFDAHPANQAIPLIEGVKLPCLRLEKDFVLERFAESKILPAPFRAAARRLRAHYEATRAAPRRPARPPIGDVEVVYMDPTFEAMLLQDAAALRRVFGLERTPRDWPALPHSEDRPDFALRKIVDTSHRRGPPYLRQRYDARKHAWAHEILREAADGSAIWKHAIVQRLAKVLV